MSTLTFSFLAATTLQKVSWARISYGKINSLHIQICPKILHTDLISLLESKYQRSDYLVTGNPIFFSLLTLSWIYAEYKVDHCTCRILQAAMLMCLSCVTHQTYTLFLYRMVNLLISAAAVAAKSLQSCPTLCDPTDVSPPGFPVPWILKARTLEWVAISFSNVWKWKVKVKSLSHVWLVVIP